MTQNENLSNKRSKIFIILFVSMFIILLILTPFLIPNSIYFRSLWISINLLSLSIISLLYKFGIIKSSKKWYVFRYGSLFTGIWGIFYTILMTMLYGNIGYITGIPFMCFFFFMFLLFLKKQKR